MIHDERNPEPRSAHIMMRIALSDAKRAGAVVRITIRSGVQFEGVIDTNVADLDTVHLKHTDGIGWTTVDEYEIVAVSASRKWG